MPDIASIMRCVVWSSSYFRRIHYQGKHLCPIVLAYLLKRSLLEKERIHSHREQILSFKSRPLFLKDLVCKKAKRNRQATPPPLSKRAEILSSVLSS